MTAIYVETTDKKSIACSLEWPGWCRTGKTEDAAIQALEGSIPRYRIIANRAGLTFEPGELVVVERVDGDMTTSFGAPSQTVSSDTEPVDAATAERGVALLRAAWQTFDEVVAASANELRKGPRGGGRERDEILRHVIEVERTYARKIGVRHKPFSPEDLIARDCLRDEIAETLSKPSNGSPLVSGGWLATSALRRMNWHVIDHIWEIEDRQI